MINNYLDFLLGTLNSVENYFSNKFLKVILFIPIQLLIGVVIILFLPISLIILFVETIIELMRK